MLAELKLDNIYRVLKAIEKKPLTKSDILTVWNSSSVHHYIELFEKKGIVEKKEVRDGRKRYYLYSITDKGKRLIKALEIINDL